MIPVDSEKTSSDLNKVLQCFSTKVFISSIPKPEVQPPPRSFRITFTDAVNAPCWRMNMEQPPLPSLTGVIPSPICKWIWILSHPLWDYWYLIKQISPQRSLLKLKLHKSPTYLLTLANICLSFFLPWSSYLITIVTWVHRFDGTSSILNISAITLL